MPTAYVLTAEPYDHSGAAVVWRVYCDRVRAEQDLALVKEAMDRQWRLHAVEVVGSPYFQTEEPPTVEESPRLPLELPAVAPPDESPF